MTRALAEAAAPAWRSSGRLLPVVGPPLALLAACLFFAAQSDRFLTGDNLSLVLQQVMVVGVLAVGQTLVILTAGIDLSCGMVMALAGVVMTRLAALHGLDPALAVGAGIGVALLFGLVNGWLVSGLGLPPFIVTLGTLNIAFALTQLWSEAQTITDVPASMTALGNTFAVGSTTVVYGVLVMLAIYLLSWVVLGNTAAGRHVYAVGDAPEAARLVGIATGRVLLGVYAAAGVLYGIAALLLVARTGVGDPNAGQTENLDAVTAVVLGGTSLFGGRGVILGSLVGALIVGVFRNGLTLMGVSSVWQILVTGVLVILAVGLDRLARRGAR